jgi:hypothetical protein
MPDGEHQQVTEPPQRSSRSAECECRACMSDTRSHGQRASRSTRRSPAPRAFAAAISSSLGFSAETGNSIIGVIATTRSGQLPIAAPAHREHGGPEQAETDHRAIDPAECIGYGGIISETSCASGEHVCRGVGPHGRDLLDRHRRAGSHPPRSLLVDAGRRNLGAPYETRLAGRALRELRRGGSAAPRSRPVLD